MSTAIPYKTEIACGWFLRKTEIGYLTNLLKCSVGAYRSVVQWSGWLGFYRTISLSKNLLKVDVRSGLDCCFNTATKALTMHEIKESVRTFQGNRDRASWKSGYLLWDTKHDIHYIKLTRFEDDAGRKPSLKYYLLRCWSFWEIGTTMSRK